MGMHGAWVLGTRAHTYAHTQVNTHRHTYTHIHIHTHTEVTCVNTRLARYSFSSAHSFLAARDDCYACERGGRGEEGGRERERKSTLESTSKENKWRGGLAKAPR
jgi:hypothetical protein